MAGLFWGRRALEERSEARRIESLPVAALRALDGSSAIVVREEDARFTVSRYHAEEGTVWSAGAAAPIQHPPEDHVVAGSGGVFVLAGSRDALTLHGFDVGTGARRFAAKVAGSPLPEPQPMQHASGTVYLFVERGEPHVVGIDVEAGGERFAVESKDLHRVWSRDAGAIVSDRKRRAVTLVRPGGSTARLLPELQWGSCTTDSTVLYIRYPQLHVVSLADASDRVLTKLVYDPARPDVGGAMSLAGCVDHDEGWVLAIVIGLRLEVRSFDASGRERWRTDMVWDRGYGAFHRVGRYWLVPLAEGRGGGMSLPGTRQIVLLGLDDGKVVWRRATTGRSISTGAVAGDVLALKFKNRFTIAIDGATGEIVAARTLPAISQARGTMGSPHSKRSGWQRYVIEPRELLDPSRAADAGFWHVDDATAVLLDAKTLAPHDPEVAFDAQDAMSELDKMLPPAAEPEPRD